jgi:hypothetical protein
MGGRDGVADSKLIVRAYGELHEEAIAVAEGRSDMSAAVARLVRLIPPTRVDLIDELLYLVVRRALSATVDWPPANLLQQLVYRLKQVHAGEMPEELAQVIDLVDVIRYRDKMQYDRRCYRLTRHGMLVGEFMTPEEFGKVVDLAALAEDDPGQAATPPDG